jgi:hypothetical protein
MADGSRIESLGLPYPKSVSRSFSDAGRTNDCITGRGEVEFGPVEKTVPTALVPATQDETQERRN